MDFLKNGYKAIFNKGGRKMTASKTILPVENAEALKFFNAEGTEIDTTKVKFVYAKVVGNEFKVYVSESNAPTATDTEVIVKNGEEVVIGPVAAAEAKAEPTADVTPEESGTGEPKVVEEQA